MRPSNSNLPYNSNPVSPPSSNEVNYSDVEENFDELEDIPFSMELPEDINTSNPASPPSSYSISNTGSPEQKTPEPLMSQSPRIS